MDIGVVERLEKLERQMRRWKTASLLLLAILGMVLMTGAAYSSSDGLIQLPAARLSANSFVLVGVDGNVYGRLTVRAGKPEFRLFDQTGKVIWAAPPEAIMKPVTPAVVHPDDNPKPE